MNSMFLKVFLWFWLAMVIVAIALALSIAVTRQKAPPPDPEQLIAVTLDAIGTLALERREREGPDTLSQFAADLAPEGAQVYVYHTNPTSSDLEHTSSAVREMVRRADQTGEYQQCKEQGRVLYARPVSDKQGNRVIAVLSAPDFALFWDTARDLQPLALRVLVTVMVAGLVCYGLARSITAPLERLRAFASRFALGELGLRVSPQLVTSGGEVGALANALNCMAESVDSLVLSHKQLLRDVSHELQSPLTRLQLALMLARKGSDEQVSHSLDRIEQEAERLSRMISQLLTLARAESAAEREACPVDLTKLLKTILHDSQFEAQSRSVTVRFDKSAEVITPGHADLLYSAIENVVRNAMRWTAPQSQVRVSLDQEMLAGHYRAVIRVRDQGPGIPDEDLQRVLAPFCAIGEEGRQRNDRAGLGLAIVDRVIKQHSGDLRLANAPEGGLIVEIALPTD